MKGGLLFASVLILVLISGCVKEDTYTAYKDDLAVLEFQDKPGYIVSTGYFPDVEPVKHQFLSAQALVPDYEEELGQLIRDSNTFDEFVSLLEENGYTVKEGRAEKDEEDTKETPEAPPNSILIYVDEDPEDVNNINKVHIANVTVSEGKLELIVIEEHEEIGRLRTAIIEIQAKETLPLIFEEMTEIDGEVVLAMKEKEIYPEETEYIYAVKDELEGYGFRSEIQR